MAALYADEQFPRVVVEKLRNLGHDILTVQDANRRGDPDEHVLAFATSKQRTVLTINRKDFIRLHYRTPNHAGIIVCKQRSRLATLSRQYTQSPCGTRVY